MTISKGAANVIAIRNHGGLGSNNYSVRAAVKNLGFNKTVKVRYTVDNWKTYKEASLNMASMKIILQTVMLNKMNL